MSTLPIGTRVEHVDGSVTGVVTGEAKSPDGYFVYVTWDDGRHSGYYEVPELRVIDGAQCHACGRAYGGGS